MGESCAARRTARVRFADDVEVFALGRSDVIRRGGDYDISLKPISYSLCTGYGGDALRVCAAVQDGIVPHLNEFRPCRKKYLRSEVTEKQLQMAADKGVPSATWARMERHLLDGTSFEGSRKQKTGVIQELPRGDTKNCRAACISVLAITSPP